MAMEERGEIGWMVGWLVEGNIPWREHVVCGVDGGGEWHNDVRRRGDGLVNSYCLATLPFSSSWRICGSLQLLVHEKLCCQNVRLVISTLRTSLE